MPYIKKEKFDEIKGIFKEIEEENKIRVTCPNCNGSGKVGDQNQWDCSVCDGKGYMQS